MLPDAVKYPLVYLNFAIYCVQMKRYEMAGIYLANFFSVSEHTAVRHEVSVMNAGGGFCCRYYRAFLSLLKFACGRSQLMIFINISFFFIFHFVYPPV